MLFQARESSNLDKDFYRYLLYWDAATKISSYNAKCLHFEDEIDKEFW